MNIADLIADFSVENATRWLRSTFPSFDSSRKQELSLTENEKRSFCSKILMGYVTNLPKAKGDSANTPLLVAAIRTNNDMTNRSSRLMQFNTAKNMLKSAVAMGNTGIRDGMLSHGIFFFYDDKGSFRISLVSGEVEGKTFKFNSARRQSFFVKVGAPNNIVKRRLPEGRIPTYAALQEAFSVDALTKDFYSKLFNWYRWAMLEESGITLPNNTNTHADDRDWLAEALIRLITRLMFVWFIRQKDIVPGELFQTDRLKGILKTFNPNSMDDDNYYRCILQNLFFATLNCPANKRGFIKESGGWSKQHDLKTFYRYQDEFIAPDKFLAMLKRTPFLNCALFDCLDRKFKNEDGSETNMLLDGFSQIKDRRAHLPNILFWEKSRQVLLNKADKQPTEVCGIISLFSQYEFTVDENNADDADVALDPELLGKVFENLLGAFNPETQETARKATGSFYTPREIVDYMTEESLRCYLREKVSGVPADVLDELFSKEENPNSSRVLGNLSKEQKNALLNAVYDCKVLDPACGSGAFPMGILHCMTRLLEKLDPFNTTLNGRLIELYREERERLSHSGEENFADKIKQLDEQFKEERIYPDYARKLWLIENCIYGIDIQPIATQISKLRFYISLLCDQLRSNFSPEENERNYGLLSLPDLAAKFVCANTLIPLPKPDGGELALHSPKIEDLRKDLQRTRHEIFKARTMETRDKYRTQDAELRKRIQTEIQTLTGTPDQEKIRNLESGLETLRKQLPSCQAPKLQQRIDYVGKDLFNPGTKKTVTVDVNKEKREDLLRRIANTEQSIERERNKAKNAKNMAIDEMARQVASWDPYDQNASSPFFDAEWMFNVKDGFDIVIGNPPYGVKLSNKEVECAKENYTSTSTKTGLQKGSLDSFVLFIEKGIKSLIPHGNLCFIVPMSITSGDSMQGIQNLLLETCPTIRISSYAVRPQPVFQNAVVNTSILFCSYSHDKCKQLLMTKLYRKRNEVSLQNLLGDLSFVNTIDFIIPGRFPKISFPIECSILKKLSSHSPLKNYLSSQGSPIYYRTSGGRYFKIVTDYSTGSNKEKSILFQKEFARCIGAVLSSNLSFWFYQIFSNNLDWKSSEILSFTMPNFTQTEQKILSALYSEYLSDVEANANIRTTSGKSRYTMDKFKEYKIGMSKKIIDKIDDFIAPVYGLTQEEITFIKNYEISYRLTDAEEQAEQKANSFEPVKTVTSSKPRRKSSVLDEEDLD